MKIRTKLLLVLSTLPILVFLLIGTSLFQLTDLEEMKETTQSNYELSYLANDIHKEVKNEAISLRTALLHNDKEAQAKEIASLKQIAERVNQDIAMLQTKVVTRNHKEMVANLSRINQEFNVYREKVIQSTLDGKKQEAIYLITTDGVALHENFLKIISEITETFGEHVNSSQQKVIQDFRKQIIIGSVISLIGLLIVISIVFKSVWSIATRLNKVSGTMKSVASGEQDLSTKIKMISNDEIDEVASSFNTMVESLEEKTRKEQNLTWIKSNIADITTNLTRILDLESLSKTFLSKVVPLVDSCHAVFYLKEDGKENPKPRYKLLASYAFKERKHLSNTFVEGEGLVGQVILEKSPIILTDVPDDYIQVKSGLGEAPPLTIYVLPVMFKGDVKAVLELASFKTFTPEQQIFLEEMVSSLGIILDNVMGRIRLAELLEESQTLMEEVQAQSEELQSQQEELRLTNEELEEQTQSLRESEEKLQVQQEELEQANEELKERAKRLEERNQLIEKTNQEMEMAQAELEEKAKQLALSSKYKSEFLANMSHELRTPINSLLLLSKLLADNHNGNLTDKQVEYSKTIYSSGKDLLLLINDILDLAKIESGKMDVNPSKVDIKEITKFVESTFIPVANEKNLEFHIRLMEKLPPIIYTDSQKLQQVLKNLLSNAFKFTSEGEVNLIVERKIKNGQPVFAFSIQDTGVGIAKEKQELIFEAFQQADGTTSRKFGGTGLGLSISREIAARLGGEIVVESEEGKGSTFTFFISDYKEENQKEINSYPEEAVTREQEETKTDDNKDTVQIESRNVEDIESSNHIKKLLIVDDDKVQRNSMMEFVGDMNVIIKAVATGFEAIEELKVDHFDCIVLDLGLEDTSGFELLEKIKSHCDFEKVKVFIYTGRSLSSKEEIFLNKYAHTIIIKDEHSPQRLKDELALFLNDGSKDKEESNSKNTPIIKEKDLDGIRILLVDDDVRNVYALSNILELYGMKVTFAENGLECLKLLEEDSSFDLVLMDIMMPEMDGYEAIKRIRMQPEISHLPIIALTAKAMKEDREKCMEVGASDYVVKPVDPDQLISLMRVWLYPQSSN